MGSLENIFSSGRQVTTCNITEPGIFSLLNFTDSDAPYGIQRGLIINVKEYGPVDMAIIFQTLREWSGQYVFFRIYNPVSDSWSEFKQVSFLA